MPSRLKLGARADLRVEGDLIVLTPLTVGASEGEGISIVKSRFGRGYCLTALGTAWAAMVMLPTTEAGESPLEDGDMSYSSRQSLLGGG